MPGFVASMPGELRLENDVVDAPLRVAERVTQRKRPRDVGGVVLVLAAGVDRQKVAVAKGAAVALS